MTDIERSSGAASTDPKLNVFISYSRADIAFADELVDGLDLMGFETTIDRHSIVEGEDWHARIGALIANADTVLFLLSPESVRSDICNWEVEEAHRCSKRILPVLVRPVGEQSVPPRLAALNYVRFDDGRSFMTGFRALVRALQTDVDWLREHTRLLARAMEWEAAGRRTNRMLAGADIAAAKAWMANRPAGAPEPTELHLAYIRASEQAEADRASAERQRLEEIRAAQEARAEALADREQAVRKLSRRTTIGLISSGTLTVAAAGLAYWGQDAERRYREEHEKRAEAERQSVEAKIRQEASRTDIEGQFVAMGASPGQYAAEGSKGGNSPYTAELLKRLDDRSTSLYEACFRAHQDVQRSSETRQNPFLSTDMNGELYLLRPNATQRRTAIVISEDRLRERGDLYNVRNDALAWEEFLRGRAGFEVTRLENPDSAAFRAAFTRLSPEPPERQGAVHPSLVHRVGLTKTTRTGAPPNTVAMFVFAGTGVQIDGSDFLMADDSDTSRVELMRLTMIRLDWILEAMRRGAAASVLVLDTNFPILPSNASR